MSLPLLLHDGCNFTAAFDNGDEIDIQHCLYIFVIHVLYFRDFNSGTVVVDQDINPPESIERFRNQCLPVSSLEAAYCSSSSLHITTNYFLSLYIDERYYVKEIVQDSHLPV